MLPTLSGRVTMKYKIRRKMLLPGERVQVANPQGPAHPTKNLNLTLRSLSVVAKPEIEDGSETMEFEFRVDLSSNSAKSLSDLMPPPTRSSHDHSSPYSTPSIPSNPSLGGSPWNEYSASPRGFPSILSNHTPPYNSTLLSPRSDPSPRISIHSMLCDPTDPNVFTPPEYQAKTPQVPTPIVIEAFTNPVATSSIFPAPAPTGSPIGTASSIPVQPVVKNAMPMLVTRTPPPLTALPPLWKEIEFHPSDESDNEDENANEEFEDIEEIRRDTAGESDALVLPATKRRRLNSHVPSDAYDLHLPYHEMELWDFYDKITCTILSCKNAQGENPWRDDLIQRAMVSDPLKHALFAMTSFHMKRYRSQEAWTRSNAGLNYTNSAFRALRKVLTDGKAAFVDENNIAAMLVLSFSQVPQLSPRSGRADSVVGLGRSYVRWTNTRPRRLQNPRKTTPRNLPKTKTYSPLHALPVQYMGLPRRSLVPFQRRRSLLP